MRDAHLNYCSFRGHANKETNYGTTKKLRFEKLRIEKQRRQIRR